MGGGVVLAILQCANQLNFMKFFNSAFLTIFVLLILGVPMSALAISAWREVQPISDSNRSWRAVASDDDGSNYVVAAGTIRRFFISTTSGETWEEVSTLELPTGAGDSTFANSDADGTNLVVLGFNSLIYTSSDGGANWTEKQPPVSLSSGRMASDADGSVLMASDGFDVYISTDGGDNWDLSTSVGGISMASDADGSFLVTTAFTGNLYTSDDGGQNWTMRSLTGTQWKVASDADGTNLIAWNGTRLYTSSDSGATWTERRPAGDVDALWLGVASDDDGSHLIVANYSTGDVYVSTDGGVSWTLQVGVSGSYVASDVDGSNLIAAKSSGRVYVYGPDIYAPTISSLSPMDNATEVAVDEVFHITFNEDIATSTGDITLKRASDDSIVETIDAAGPKVTLSDTNIVTIDPSTTLEVGVEYYFLVDNGALEDLAGNAFAGIADTTTWSFTADAPPSVTEFSPEDGATEFSRANPEGEIYVAFDQSVIPVSGNIILKKTSNNSVIETFDVTNGEVVDIYDNEVYLYSAVTLDYATDYYFLIDAGAFEDENGNAFAGISDTTTWNFKTDSLPSVVTFFPADDASGVATTTDLVITFNQEVYPVLGDVVLHLSDNSIVERFAIEDVLSENGATEITINPTENLSRDAAYYVQIDPTALIDALENGFAGISDSTIWNFTTAIIGGGSTSYVKRIIHPVDTDAQIEAIMRQLIELLTQLIAQILEQQEA